MLSELSHKDPIFLLFSAHKTRLCRAFDYGPYMPYYRLHAFVLEQKHNTSVKHRHSHVFALHKAPITDSVQQTYQIRCCEFYVS